MLKQQWCCHSDIKTPWKQTPVLHMSGTLLRSVGGSSKWLSSLEHTWDWMFYFAPCRCTDIGLLSEVSKVPAFPGEWDTKIKEEIRLTWPTKYVPYKNNQQDPKDSCSGVPACETDPKQMLSHSEEPFNWNNFPAEVCSESEKNRSNDFIIDRDANAFHYFRSSLRLIGRTKTITKFSACFVFFWSFYHQRLWLVGRINEKASFISSILQVFCAELFFCFGW